jgi:methionyl-tRNA formyltransferase
MRIVFFGTPDFSIPALQILLENNFEIAAVVTAPDKPAGRGLTIKASPVKEFAMANALNILQPVKLQDPIFLAELAALNADLFIVIAFRMLPESVWSMPPKGTFNLHASLLPQYRGAAPINWAIINGEKVTGLTTFFLQHEIDTGNIIFQEPVLIPIDINVGELYEVMKIKGADLVLKTVKAIQVDNYPLLIQEGVVKHAPKIFKEHSLLNFNHSVEQVHNHIRGLSPYPGAYMLYKNKILKIFKSKLEIITHKEKPGTMISDNKTYIKIACLDGFIYLENIQLEGKKVMPVVEFLKGNVIGK